MHDLVIRNALLLDGLGGEPYVADLAVATGRIAEIGKGLSGRETFDADGLALMPGIIDNHTHYDAQVTWDPTLAPSPSLGVTTAVIGNCGFTIAPCRPADRELVMKNLTQVEGTLAWASIWAKSLGPNQSMTTCTRLDVSALPRLGSSNSATSPLVPSIEARLPPADCPKAAILSGFSLYVAALARKKRTAALASSTAAGKIASPDSR